MQFQKRLRTTWTPDAVVKLSAVSNSVLEMLLGERRFLLTSDDADFGDLAGHGDEPTKLLSSREGSLFDPSLKKTLVSPEEHLANYASLADPLHNITRQRTRLYTRLDALGPQMDGDLQALNSEVVGHRGARACRAAAGSGTMITVIAVSLVVVVLGTLLAVTISRWLSGTIGIVTVSMIRMADGNIDFELPRRDRGGELGRMIRALEASGTNALALRDADRERETALARDAERQAMRYALQHDVEQVVSASARGDFSRRLTCNYDSRHSNAFAESVNNIVATVERGLKETVTQHNAALVEETDAAIEQTLVQADQLDGIRPRVCIAPGTRRRAPVEPVVQGSLGPMTQRTRSKFAPR